MKITMLGPRAWIGLILIAAADCALAQVTGGACAAVEDSAPEWFAGQLDAAESAHRQGNELAAFDTLYRAESGLPRRADVSVDGRCVGPDLWGRFYALRRAVTLELGRQAERNGALTAVSPGNQRSALDWYITGDSRDEVARLLERIRDDVKAFGWAGQRLSAEVAVQEHAAGLGLLQIPDEASALAFYRARLDDAMAWSRQQAGVWLTREAAIVNGDVTADEERLQRAEADARSLAAAFVGDDSVAGLNEARIEVGRVSASLDALREASGWLSWMGGGKAALEPVTARALLRGDGLVEKAEDEAVSLEARDSYYDAASEYFAFAQDRERLLAVERGRAAIAPALEAERGRRSEALEARQAELQEAARRAQESTRQTDAEKQDFQTEADSLEAELGF